MSTHSSDDDDHRWTAFENQTMLSLIARGVHLPNHETTNRATTDRAIRKNIEEEFCTAFNKALHGDKYKLDLERTVILTELKRVLIAQKHVTGPGGLVERGKSKRITRALNASWRTNRKGDFDGSLGEWKAWRKNKVENERRREQGLPSLEEDEELSGVQNEDVEQQHATESSSTQIETQNSTTDLGTSQSIQPAFNADELAPLLLAPKNISSRESYRQGGAIVPKAFDRDEPASLYSNSRRKLVRANGGPVRRVGFTADDFISNNGSSPPISSTPNVSPMRASSNRQSYTNAISPTVAYENSSSPALPENTTIDIWSGKVTKDREVEVKSSDLIPGRVNNGGPVGGG